MNKSYIGGCTIIVAAAGLGYWLFSDRLTKDRPPAPKLNTAELTVVEPIEITPQFYASRSSGDVIDLARVFEPTGEELDLQTLLYGQPEPELAPSPRATESELAPMPRTLERELLPAPLAVESFSDAGEEASSLPRPRGFLTRSIERLIAIQIAEWLLP